MGARHDAVGQEGCRSFRARLRRWGTPCCAVAIACAGSHAAFAAESGVGFYLLGSCGPAAGVVPPPETYLQNGLYFYSGSAPARLEPPLGGGVAGGVDADATVNLLSGLWSTTIPALGGDVAFSATLPIGYLDVRLATLLGRGPGKTF